MYVKLLGEVNGIYNRLTLIDLFVSLLWVIVGLLLMTNPEMSNVIFSVTIGIIFILNSFNCLYSFFKRRDIILYNLNIIYGLVMLILGILSLIFKNILQVMLGIYFLILGLQKLTYGLLLKKYSETSWLLTFVVGVLFITMGIISFFSENIIMISGVCLLGYGLINIVNVILLRKRSRYYIV